MHNKYVYPWPLLSTRACFSWPVSRTSGSGTFLKFANTVYFAYAINIGWKIRWIIEYLSPSTTIYASTTTSWRLTFGWYETCYRILIDTTLQANVLPQPSKCTNPRSFILIAKISELQQYSIYHHNHRYSQACSGCSCCLVVVLSALGSCQVPSLSVSPQNSRQH